MALAQDKPDVFCGVSEAPESSIDQIDRLSSVGTLEMIPVLKSVKKSQVYTDFWNNCNNSTPSDAEHSSIEVFTGVDLISQRTRQLHLRSGSIEKKHRHVFRHYGEYGIRSLLGEYEEPASCTVSSGPLFLHGNIQL